MGSGIGIIKVGKTFCIRLKLVDRALRIFIVRESEKSEGFFFVERFKQDRRLFVKYVF